MLDGLHTMSIDFSPYSELPVILLAAGRGERMRPLTDSTPKPLLEVRGKTLLAWRLEALQRAGLHHVLINTAWLGSQIPARLGTHFDGPGGALPSVQLRYSHEGDDFGHALETAGGIARALPALDVLFWAMAGDVFAPDFLFESPEPTVMLRLRNATLLGHIWLIPNPVNNPQGDFGWDPVSGLALNLDAADPRARWTYSTIGIFHRDLFAPPWCAIAPGNPNGTRAALAPLLRAAMDQGRISASLYTGSWTDVGTPERLAALNLPFTAP